MIRAEAEAQANELLQKSLTELILQQEYIDKWNGQLPSVMTGDGSSSVVIPVMGDRNSVSETTDSVSETTE